MACRNESKLIQQANQLSTGIAQELAPDNREAVYSTSFAMDSNKSLVVSGETSLPEAKSALLSALEGLNVHVVDSLKVLPDKKLGEKNWALTNLSVVNLRAHPRHSAELVSQAIMGTPVRVLKKKSSWYLVQTPDNYIAWIDQAAIVLKEEKEMENWRNAEKVIFTSFFTTAKNPYSQEVVTDLVAGSILEIEEIKQKFYDLLLPDGRKIRLDKSLFMRFDEWKGIELKDASLLTKTAAQFIGHPYLWGGTSIKGVDCSGFVKSVYFMNGIILARDASLQFLYGDPILPEQGFGELAEGDLVFFGQKASQEKPIKVTHVGMYMNHGEYIHAAGRVKINSFNPDAENYNDYRSASWLGGRKVLNRTGESGIVRVAEHPWY